MKKLLFFITITAVAALVMTSCKNSVAPQQSINPIDTIGLSAFQNWKLQQYQEAMNANTNAAVQTTAPIKRATYASNRSTYKSGSMNSTSTHTAETAPITKKKGMSKAAKGAVIGGAGGAVLGAVINKRNRVAGGIIGGVIGGAVGYGIGRSKDKQDGRY